MGRSKFPGKPSKHVNRKRVNVLPPTTDTNTECSRSVTVETVVENKQAQDESEENASGANTSINTKVSLRRRLNRKLQSSKSLLGTNSAKRSLLSKICNKSVKNKITNKSSRPGAITRKPHSYAMKNLTRRNSTAKETSNIVGKFVLPTRSVHSSRVIKPNKRFINVDLSDTLSLKKKVITKRHCLKQDEDQTKSINCLSESSVLHETSKTFTNGRVVLRQARLKLHTQTPTGTEGPFSSKPTTGSPPGTVTCGVCGAVRFYRFVKQARKFNIYSCESCRKFISKMIKKQNCGKSVPSNALVCHKGQGMCHVPPIVRSQQMKLIRCAYKARCPACWLKMCLRSFQMPMSLKHSLVQLLPKNMQGSDVIFSNSLPLLWQASVQNITSTVVRDENKNEAIKQRPVRFKHSKTPVMNVTPASSDIKRQKIDLKGPRVKHVCRSASIVLGQPLATFPADADKTKSDNKEQVEAKKIDDVVKSDDASVKNTKPDPSSSENESSDSDKLPKLPLIVNDTLITNIKRDKSHRIPYSMSIESKMNVEKKRDISELPNTISLDYWENYDLDDVSQNGFCLIASQQFPMSAVCFLCGSVGREAFLHCSLCCEPYHPFCLEQSPPINNNNNRQSVWLCPRCTTCSACNQTDRQKLNCQKCSKAYHAECFNTKWSSADKPTVCSKCLTCKSCGDETTTKFVGNLPLCVMCFKLRKKGNVCPICQGSYDDSDFSEKVMECTGCNKWIHAKCEGLSEEYYRILSILPEKVRYLCCLCSKESIPLWRKAAEAELKFNFNQVVRLLSKNKVAKNMLKLSPLNNHVSLSKTITTVKKLQFSNEDDDDSLTNCFEDYNQNENNNKITTDLIHFESTTNEPKILSMLDVRNKLNSNEYNSLRDFNKDMEEALKNAQSEELLGIYRMILFSVFPWFKSSLSENEIKSSFTLRQEFGSAASSCDVVCAQTECTAFDSRFCSFCKTPGDGLSHLESRLLYCGQNEWVHINCALWSSEVYEEIDGSLQNVHSALSRGRLMRCSYCKQRGATVGCCFKNCYETYHFLCARTAKCHFMHDKTMYCFGHCPPETSIVVAPTEFSIHRSVFVEISDSKKGKFSQVDKVNVMVGSLCVTSLGKINPTVSDSVDAIIPTGYVCSRLFWSTVEPWKLVSYKISTSILNAHVNSLFIDKNFTVDHTLSKPLLEKKLREVMMWQKDIDKKKSDIIDFDDEEEPQNGADLLSPEITDAIFEELPHELLDGISVQDIFPKLMSYEDFINMESNNSDLISGDLLKKTESEIENLAEFDVNNETDKSKNQQRSCSLTLSCKLDNAFSPAIKKRKIAPRENNLFFQLLQVDGNFDDSSSSECGSPIGTGDPDFWNSAISEEPVTCERCHCTYRTKASYKRHLDSCELMCSSESDSEINQDQDNASVEVTNRVNVVESSTVVINEAPQPVVLTSYESFQNEIHTSVLNTQTFVSSKSTELISVPQIPEVVQLEPKPLQLPVNTVAPLATNHQSIETSLSNEAFTVSRSVSVNEPIPNQFCLNQTVPLCVNQPITLPNGTISMNPGGFNQIAINQSGISINQPHLEFQPPVTLQSVSSYPNNITPIINVTPQNQLITNPNIINSVVAQVPANRWMKPVGKPAVFAKNPKCRGRGRTIAAKRSQFEENETLIIPASNSGPSVIVQHLPSTSFIPTFVDAFQQQTGQNVQYVATITPQLNSTLHSQPLMQLQDNNIISLLPGMQPTMIIQQPRVMENQLVLDSNGSLCLAQQPVQPVYYGFETIVQNTVMQSQQFLPTTVPGVLAANSSYSTTTQVFQTSKLEPVMDVSGNSYVLLNPGQLVNHQPIEMQNTQQVNTLSNNIVQNSVKQSLKYSPHFDKPTVVTPVNTNSITLPTAPFVSEQGIPTNIVTPTPKLPTATQSRPMSRVLPMQTMKETNKVKLNKPDVITKEMTPLSPLIKHLEAVVCGVEFEKNKSALPPVNRRNPVEIHLRTDQLDVAKSDSLKLVFQKQSLDGTYKISNSFFEKPQIQESVEKLSFNCKSQEHKNSFYKNPPIAPLKPIKSNYNVAPQPIQILPLTDKQNKQEKIERKTGEASKHLQQEKKENENNPSILYTIETQDGFNYSSTSLADLWTKVFEAVQSARALHNMPPLPPDSTNIMNNLQILGLKTSGLKYLIEQLPGASKCTKYKPSFNFPCKYIEIEDEPLGHTNGCARCLPNIKRNDPYDMFGWLASKHRNPEQSLVCSELVPRRGSINNLPMAMRFRQLKLTSKYSVGVYWSKIHRRGLFCLRDFEAGEMVIEYSGEVIRSILTDKREKFYNSKGIGCYMFRIDDNLVVDATMTGNAARFINHSCDPNCYSKVVEILGHKHIIIFALRRIICGEELTYDYKFPIEEDKIPCTCGTRRLTQNQFREFIHENSCVLQFTFIPWVRS